MADDEPAGQPVGLEADAYDQAKTGSSKSWLTMIADAEKVFRDYQDKSDNIDKLYANLEKLSNIARDRQFQLFWANIGILGPSVYSRPPVPVVVPRFKDRKPLPRVASELLERCTVVSFEYGYVDSVMRAVRDDLIVLARGAAWVRYEAEPKNGYLSEKVCVDHVDRKDFLHEPGRIWEEVDWVAKRSWMTKQAMKKRFKKYSGDAYKDAGFEKRKDDKDGDDGKLKAGVWELWCKSLNKCVWVTEGVDVTLDEDKPHLTLEGFFPCPKPAYATVQRRSLIPVPDMLFYKDQLEEINEITARISALTDAVKVRGFYPAGAGDIGDAIEAAVKATTDNKMLVPISNWAMIGQGGVKDMIVWMPIDMIVATIKELIEQRKQLIDDVYQITGLSDIMRGATDPNETLGAQEMKSQYGSVRIRDRQAELVRFARDLTRIVAEIVAENFQPKTLLEMSQLDIKTDDDVSQEVMPLQQQLAAITAEIARAQRDPEVRAMAQQNPEQAQKIIGQVQQQAVELQAQIAKVGEQVTVEKVVAFLRDQRTRPFVLDIETDSTIAPDENATKQRATEFITAVGGFMNQAMPLVQTVPQAAPLAAETLKYVAAQFRAGRQLEGVIEEFADNMKQLAGQPKPEDPAVAQARQEAEAKAQAVQLEMQRKAQDDELKAREAARKREQEAQDAAIERQRKADEHAYTMDTKAIERQQLIDKHAVTMEQARVKSDDDKAKRDADLAAKKQDGENKAIENGFPPGYSFEDDRAQFKAIMSEIAEGRQMSAQMMAQLAEQTNAIVAALTAPKVLVKDAQGSPVGVKTMGLQ